jgi:F-type H+-transporting ATPase subunit b
MLIDWFTVGAQALNFIVLVWLLKRFLYKPILDAIDAREQRIAAELAEADGKMREARAERDEFQRKNQEFERQRAALLSKVTEEAKAERQRLMEDARAAAETFSAKRMVSLRREAHELDRTIGARVQAEIFSISRKALADLASTALEASVVEAFARRLRGMGAEERLKFARALKSGGEPALVRSAFDLNADQRVLLGNALKEVFAVEIPLRFETSPALIAGVELTGNGQKLAWSIRDYLASLQEGVDTLLSDPALAEPGQSTQATAEPSEIPRDA